MSVRRLKQEMDNINSCIASTALHMAEKYTSLSEQERAAFIERIKTLGERANAISISISVLDKTE